MRLYLQLYAERQATVVALRVACQTYGDNDWDDDLFLPDVVEKHLVRVLDETLVIEEE